MSLRLNAQPRFASYAKRRCTPRGLLIVGIMGCLSCTGPSEGANSDETGGLETPAGDLPGWAYEFEEVGDFGGIGSLAARPMSGGIANDLHLRDLQVRVEAAGQLASFEVEHTFVNESDEQLEGTFRFTLPPDAVVHGLAMQIGGKWMEAEIVGREKAQRIYQDIVDNMRDPAILEWEQGRSFKLRVFPIEARGEKRIILRYLAPLGVDPRRGPGAYRIIYPTVAPENQGLIDHFSMHINGSPAFDRRDFEAKGDIRVPLPRGASAADLVVEKREDADYYALRVTPRWDELPLSPRREGPRTRVIWVDSSRSSLESWELAKESAMALISDLGPDDQFALLCGDLFTTRAFEGLRAPSATSLAELEAFLHGVEVDGASDFSAALNDLSSLVGDAQSGRIEVIYIGDGTPTWGPIDVEALRARTELALGHADFHALLLGKHADAALMQALVGVRSGRVFQPAGPADLRRFTTFLKHADQIKSVRELHFELEADESLRWFDSGEQTLFEGRESYLYFQVPTGQRPPSMLRLTGRSGQTVNARTQPVEVDQKISIAPPTPGQHVAKLWAARKIEALGSQSANKDDVIALSEQFGVLSRHTALLVLESEEAYREHKIERRKAKEAEMAQRAAQDGSTRVSGRDLESMGGDARLAPGDIQPGDPEIHIPAPADARSVTATFPFGETKIATWDPSLGKWNLRFLIDAATAPGRYEVQIRIVHADSSVEMRRANYTVDTSAPFMEMTVNEVPGQSGVYLVTATQALKPSDAGRAADQGAGAGLAPVDRVEGEVKVEGQDPTQRASDAADFDAKSVEVVMPDGQTLTLRWVAAGRFEKQWRPRSEPAWPAQVDLMATDRALNVRRMQLELPGPLPIEPGADQFETRHDTGLAAGPQISR